MTNAHVFHNISGARITLYGDKAMG